MNDKTHYRKAFDSPYLSSADIVGRTTLTIDHVSLEGDRTKKTNEVFNTAHFVEAEIRPGEKLKPMILNATNSRTLRDRTGSHYINDWVKIPVTIFVDPNVRFRKDTVEGLRIDPKPPRERHTLAPDTPQFDRAVTAYRRDGNLDTVTKHMIVPDDVAALIKQVAKKQRAEQASPAEGGQHGLD